MMTQLPRLGSYLHFIGCYRWAVLGPAFLGIQFRLHCIHYLL